MKWVYFVLAVALLPLAMIQAVGVAGHLLGWWDASPQTVRESSAWAAVLSVLCAASALRWRSLARPRQQAGFPLDDLGAR
jgi:hypothetical protein